MNTVRDRSNSETQYIPKYCEFDNFLQSKLKVVDLRQIQTHYKIKNSKRGKKQQMIDDIYTHLKHSHYCIRIQRAFKNHIARKIIKLRGPGCIRKELCVNETDFYTLDDIKAIPFNEFISFKDSKDQKIYGCSIFSLTKLIISQDINNSNIEILNPYTRNKIDYEVIKQVRSLTKYCKMSKLKYIAEEHMIEPKLTKKQRFNQRLVNVFKAMDDLGNYTQIEWFYEMNTNIKLIKFIRDLYDIWNYRANLQPDVKSRICNHVDPFINVNIGTISVVDYNQLNWIVLAIVEKFVYNGINQESRALGAYYVLSALTLVSESCAEAMPWLYSSVA